MRRITLIMVSVLLGLSTSSQSAFADQNTYNPATSLGDMGNVLSPGSGVTISSADIHHNVFTFQNFNPQINPSLVDNPSDYELNAPGILLQAKSGVYENPNSNYGQPLQDLLAAAYPDATPNVTDASGVTFDFLAPGANGITLDFLLGSGEFHTGDYDVAAILVDGHNYAYFPDGHLLRVNAVAQISNVCSIGFPAGCYISNYDINGVILGSISKKLTLTALLDDSLMTHTFQAIVANTQDYILPTSLLFGNLTPLFATQSEIQAFGLGIQIETPVAPEIVEINRDPDQQSTITKTSMSLVDGSGNVSIDLEGSFIEKIRAVEYNGDLVADSKFSQSDSKVSVVIPANQAGRYDIKLYNGSMPVLEITELSITSQ